MVNSFDFRWLLDDMRVLLQQQVAILCFATDVFPFRPIELQKRVDEGHKILVEQRLAGTFEKQVAYLVSALVDHALIFYLGTMSFPREISVHTSFNNLAAVIDKVTYHMVGTTLHSRTYKSALFKDYLKSISKKMVPVAGSCDRRIVSRSFDRVYEDC